MDLPLTRPVWGLNPGPPASEPAGLPTQLWMPLNSHLNNLHIRIPLERSQVTMIHMGGLLPWQFTILAQNILNIGTCLDCKHFSKH